MNIIYEDESLLVIDKPNKMLVYPSPMAKNCHWFATKELAKLGYENLHTIHRLDRPTSGVLLFAKNAEMAKEMSLLFRNKKIEKCYICLVRGYTEDEGRIEKELKKDGEGELQNASTYYKTMERNEVDRQISKYPKSRFSLLKVEPLTGRMHQIRRHLAHLRHPIIGDKRYGDRHYNKYMLEKLKMENLMLHASSLSFVHPFTKEKLKIVAPLPAAMCKLLNELHFSTIPTLLQNVD